MPDETWITLKAIAEREKISLRTLQQAAFATHLRAKKIGRDWLTTEEYFDEWNRSEKRRHRKSKE